jgi:uncharacterized protein with LGFP repeats
MIKSANAGEKRRSIMTYLGWAIVASVICGFLVKSYVDERIFKRDVKKLLAYYKHVAPGSISDGDEYNAQYLVWKFQNKKNKLWKKLEDKYGIPVREADEWVDAPEQKKSKIVDEDHDDLDNDANANGAKEDL